MIDSMERALKGRAVMITGAGSPLGAFISGKLAMGGAKAAMVGEDKDDILRHTSHILESGGIAKAYYCNVGDTESCRKVLDNIRRDFGECIWTVNILKPILAEKGGYLGAMKRMEAMKKVYEEMIAPAYALAAQPISLQGGRIINVLPCGSSGIFRETVELLSKELWEQGISVNGILKADGESELSSEELEGALFFLMNEKIRGSVKGSILSLG